MTEDWDRPDDAHEVRLDELIEEYVSRATLESIDLLTLEELPVSPGGGEKSLKERIVTAVSLGAAVVGLLVAAIQIALWLGGLFGT